MNSLGGGLNVAACVAAVISAFQDADTLVQRLKVRRVSRRLPLPPDTLEDTISQAPAEIGKARWRGVERLGRQFDESDYSAVITIQQITIQLQNGLLQRLRTAVDQDEGVDFVAMIDEADGARDGTVSALMALRQRLMHFGGGVQMPTQMGPPEVPMVPQIPQIPQFSQVPQVPQVPMAPRRSSQPPMGAVRESFAEPRRRTQVWVDPYMAKSDDVRNPSMINSQQPTNYRSGANTGQQPTHHRSGSVFGLLKRNGNRADSDDHVRKLDASSHASLQPSQSSSFYGRSNSYAGQSGPPGRAYNESVALTSRDVGNNHFEIWSPDPTGYSPYGVDAQSTFSETSRANSVTSAPGIIAPTVSTYQSNVSTAPRTLLATPSPQNDYLGFCKGAWKAQNDDPKAMIERRDFAQTAQSQMTFPSCSKCAFKGHVESRVIWNKVIVDQARGLKYRWSFLAKSHVNRKLGAKDRNYAYQCIFCVFMGTREQIIYTESTYLEHVSHVHRTEKLHDVILDRTRCINDRVCENNERFDINLIPVPVAVSPRRSFALYDQNQLAYDLKAFELSA